MQRNQCIAKANSTGERCKNSPMEGFQYCVQHKKIISGLPKPTMPNISLKPLTKPRESNSMAILGFICALVSIILSWVLFILFWVLFVNLLLCVLGVVFSGIGMNNSNNRGAPYRRIAIAGLVIALVPTPILHLVFILVIASA